MKTIATKVTSAISAGEIQSWFSDASPKGKTPSALDCNRMANRLQDLQRIYNFDDLCPAVRPTKTALGKSFDNLVKELRSEAEEQLRWELFDRQKLEPGAVGIVETNLSNWLFEAIRKIEEIQSRLPNPSGIVAWSSDFQNVTVSVAFEILLIWNLNRRKRTSTIGRETPCESVLVAAMTRLTGKNIEADRLRAELSRGNPKLLRSMLNYPREELEKRDG